MPPGSPPSGRAKPRWSKASQVASSPASIAGLPANGRRVSVKPPWSANGPSRAATPSKSPGPSKPQVRSLLRLWAPLGSDAGAQSPPTLSAIRLFVTTCVAAKAAIPPPEAASFPVIQTGVVERRHDQGHGAGVARREEG